MRDRELILGLWDGHDAGACLISGSDILFAVNEERLSRRKLEVGFPSRSIAVMLKACSISPADISVVAISTTDPAKTLTRYKPSLREEYYLIRRRKKPPDPLMVFKKLAKYRITELKPNIFSRWLSSRVISGELSKLGFGHVKLEFVDHHSAHAAAAAFTSGFDDCLVLTVDGIGDGLSGTLSLFENNNLRRIAELAGSPSLGIFFEHVTNLLNMRELEDEGKVMALATYAYPEPDIRNPLLPLITVHGLKLVSPYSSLQLYRRLRQILWHCSYEQFAYYAQQTLERRIGELVAAALKVTGKVNVAYAGGVASNVKANLSLRENGGVQRLYVFPHMGDGGLALGSAMSVNQLRNKISSYPLEQLFLGPCYSESEITQAIAGWREKLSGIELEQSKSLAHDVAALLVKNSIVMWFQGRMEVGPRALGARSIIARADSEAIRDQLNLKLKKRVWYQPFCPTMLERDALELLQDYDGHRSPFMTEAFRTNPGQRGAICGVIGVDGTCRPQILQESESHPFVPLLHELRNRLGRGVMLNTSFNLHGEPVVCTPDEALKAFAEIDVTALVLGSFILRRKQ